MAFSYGTVFSDQERKKMEKYRKQMEKEAHKKKVRAKFQKVYRAPIPIGGMEGRAFAPGEFDETMKDYHHFYNQINLSNNPLVLGKSATEALKKKGDKIGTMSKKLRKKKLPVTYSLKTDPTLIANRKKQDASDAEAKPKTNMRDYKATLKFKKEKYFGGKTKKRRRKKKRKTRRKNKTKKSKRRRKKRTRRKL